MIKTNCFQFFFDTIFIFYYKLLNQKKKNDFLNKIYLLILYFPDYFHF